MNKGFEIFFLKYWMSKKREGVLFFKGSFVLVDNQANMNYGVIRRFYLRLKEKSGAEQSIIDTGS